MTIRYLKPVKVFWKGGFYIKKDGNNYWIGYKDDTSGDTHESRVSKEFYQNFLIEANIQEAKYKPLSK